MQVTVTRVLSEAGSGRWRVRFESSRGAGAGVWSSREAPEIGRERYVEFDVDEEVPLNRTLVSPPEGTPFEESDGHILLRCVVEQVDDDGMVYLRIGHDSLIMAELAPEVRRVGVHLRLRVPIDLFLITPYDL